MTLTHRVPFLISALGATVAAIGCGGSSGPSAAFLAGEEARRAVLLDIADSVVIPSQAAFVAKAEALVVAADAFAAASDDSGAATTVRSAWVGAMDSWQEQELLQFGPAGTATATPGGHDLRDRIYSWPLTNACRIDQETLSASFADAGALAAGPANVRGLDAMEYLLFNTSIENACPINAEINTGGGWAALSEAEIKAKRAAHALALARDVRDSAKALQASWTGADDFRTEFVEAGRHKVYLSAQDALNAVSHAIFYLDLELKDVKLGTPLGYSNCNTDVCPEAFEGHLSFRAKANIDANVRAFRKVFSGADTTAAAKATPRNFYALLAAAGAVEVGDRMLDATDRIESALSAITTDLESAVFNDLPAVEAVYAQIKALTDIIKTDFVSTLDLELPQRAEGDND